MKSFFQFLLSKTFVKHLAAYTLLLVLVMIGVNVWLSTITEHGEHTIVPDFAGVHISQLDEFVDDKDVTYSIADSIYNYSVSPGEVLKQDPEVGTEVKNGREVFLYIATTMPPMVNMPKLIDCSVRQAIAKIKSYGLKLGKISFESDQCTNCVLGQKIKGKAVSKGSKVFKGSVVNITVGKGLRSETVYMPCLYGLTTEEAVLKLAEVSLSVGSTIFENKNSSKKEKIYKQFPSCDDFTPLEKGSSIDLFFTDGKHKIPRIPKRKVVTEEPVTP